MKLLLKPAVDYRFSELAEILNRSFVDYFIKIEMDGPTLAQLTRYEGTDLTASRLIFQADHLVGCALIGRRGWTSRLAAMGLVPEARRQGVGRWALQQLIAEAKARDEREMVLEVIEQNTPAVQLYRQAGFQIYRRLVGYKITTPSGLEHEELQEVDLQEVAWATNTYGLPDLPWQLSGATLVETGPPSRGYRLGSAYAAISDPRQSHITLRGIIVHPDHQRQGQGTRLLQALFAAYPDKSWTVPVVYPEELAYIFEKMGFKQEALTQLQMTLDLT
jgi:ribosomal protein S18 acetylase RimI-like enzyme